jgi:purine-binding chemotaxis protein CheW
MMTDRKFVTMTVSERAVAVAVEDVIEVLRMRPISRVPHSPASLLGVTNFRNTVLPVVSLARALDIEPSPIDDDSRIVVFAVGGNAGVLVDKVEAISAEAVSEAFDIRILLKNANLSSGRSGTHRGIASNSVIERDNAAERERVAFVCVEVAGQDYALSLPDVRSISRLPSGVTLIPKSDDAIVGVSEIGSELVPLVSLRVLLGLDQSDSRRSAQAVVLVSLADKIVGLVVDGIKDVLRVTNDAIDAVPTVLTRGTGEAALTGICRMDSGRLVSILSVDRLFDAETTRRLMQSTASEGDAMMGRLQESVSREQFVVFELGSEKYGVPIAAVDEIVRRPAKLTRVPKAPSFVEGIMALRGRMVPVIDQRRRFSAAGKTGARGRVIILTIDGLQTGISVDAVSEIVSVTADQLKPAPHVDPSGSVVDRVAIGDAGENMILIIDPKALLDRAERDLLAALRDEAS